MNQILLIHYGQIAHQETKLFGTDGLRGKANHYPMTGEIAFEVGRAAAYVLKKKHGRNKILIGKDTRPSGYMLESLLHPVSAQWA